MARVLILIVLVWLVYIVIKRAFFSPDSKDPNPREAKPEQKMVQCAACGMHVPESETIKKNDLVICNNPDCNKNP
ncbi:MAG: PP0621 family protein [Pseudomonadota bacterium]